MILLDHDLSVPSGDFLTHLDDTYEGPGEHDGLVIAVALAIFRSYHTAISRGIALSAAMSESCPKTLRAFAWQP